MQPKKTRALAVLILMFGGYLPPPAKLDWMRRALESADDLRPFVTLEQWKRMEAWEIDYAQTD